MELASDGHSCGPRVRFINRIRTMNNTIETTVQIISIPRFALVIIFVGVLLLIVSIVALMVSTRLSNLLFFLH